MTDTLSPISFYSKKFWLELTLTDNWDANSISIWDLTTNPTWDRHRTSTVIAVNDLIFDDVSEFCDKYPVILASAKRLNLILAGWSNIELKRLSFIQRAKDIMKVSALLPFVSKYPEGHPLVLTNELLQLQWIRRGLEFDTNGHRQWLGKYTKEHLKNTFFNK